MIHAIFLPIVFALILIIPFSVVCIKVKVFSRGVSNLRDKLVSTFGGIFISFLYLFLIGVIILDITEEIILKNCNPYYSEVISISPFLSLEECNRIDEVQSYQNNMRNPYVLHNDNYRDNYIVATSADAYRSMEVITTNMLESEPLVYPTKQEGTVTVKDFYDIFGFYFTIKRTYVYFGDKTYDLDLKNQFVPTRYDVATKE